MTVTQTESVPLARIRVDGKTQCRAAIDQSTVKEYAAAYQAGEELPPVVLFDDGTRLWMADGFHRYGGAKLAGLVEIAAELRPGTERDALLYAAGANSKHGLKRTDADKRAAVKAILADPEWAERSNRWIADVCRVSDHLVASVRDSTAQTRSSRRNAKRTGKDGKNRSANANGTVPIRCDRCVRLFPNGGSVDDCPQCAELRGKKPRREQETAEDFDSQEDVNDAETIEEEMQRTSAAIESFCRKLMALVDAEMPEDSWLTRDGRRAGALQKFKDGCSLLRSAKCTHVCPECQGAKTTHGKKCGPCDGTGRMPKAFYDNAV